MANEIELTVRPPRGITKDVIELARRCYHDPNKADLKELKRRLVETPDLYPAVMDLADSIQDALIEKIIGDDVPKAGIRANLEVIRRDMGYDQAPMLERLLIDNVTNCWLRLQWVDYQLTRFMVGEYSLAVMEFWEKRLSTSQRRYLRAVEALARVRKITRATLQVNIAEPGSQQVNIAGDLVKSP